MKNHKIVVTAALLAGLLAPGVLQAQPQDEGAPTGQSARATVVRLNGTISALDAGNSTLTVKDAKGVETAVTLLPATTYYEREDRLKAADLAVGNIVSTPLIAKMMLTVSSLAPLTFQVGDIGVLTVNKSADMLFSRYVPLKLDALAVGTRVQGEAMQQAGGAAQASAIYVLAAKRKPVK